MFSPTGSRPRAHRPRWSNGSRLNAVHDGLDEGGLDCTEFVRHGIFCRSPAAAQLLAQTYRLGSAKIVRDEKALTVVTVNVFFGSTQPKCLVSRLACIARFADCDIGSKP